MTQHRVVQIERTDRHIIIASPYNAEFVRQARHLAGRFDDAAKSWHFDIRDEADVLEACYLAYGEDGIRHHKCDVQITLPEGWAVAQGTIVFFGRPIARAFGRDGGAKVFDGVRIKAGGFDSGGSYRHWVTRAHSGTQIILRDVSRPLVERHLANGQDDGMVVDVLASGHDLHAERARLLARLAEIDGLLEAA